MTNRTPGPVLTRLLRSPAHLYDWKAGWLLGRRFLRLTHVGRRSGRQYQAMLEVIGEDDTTLEVFVIAGLGSRAQWYRNLRAHEAIESPSDASDSSSIIVPTVWPSGSSLGKSGSG